MSRKKEAFYTVFFNLVLQLVTAVCGFILPPLIVQTFGSSINGMVSSITNFISYLNIVEAGIGGAAIVALYKPLVQKDSAKISGILSATKSFYNTSGIIFTALIFVLAFVYPLIVKGEVEATSARLMVLILGINGCGEFFLIGKYRVLLTADKKLYIISILQSGALILSTFASVLLLNAGCSILTIKLASTLLYLSHSFVLYFYVKKKYPSVDFNSPPQKAEIKQSKNVLIHQIGGLIVFNSPIVIISIFCTLKEASIYAVYALIFAAITSILYSFSNGLQGFFGESFVSDDVTKTRTIYAKYETFYFLLVLWCYSCASLLFVPFMRIYTKNMTDANYMQSILGILFIINGFLNALRNPAILLVNSAGHFKQTQNRCFIEITINIICSVIFVLKIGFYGVLIGNICSSAYRTIDAILYTNKHLLKAKTIKSLLKIVVISAVYALLSCIILRFRVFLRFENYGYWFLSAIIIAAVLIIPCFVYFLLLKKEQIKKNFT